MTIAPAEQLSNFSTASAGWIHSLQISSYSSYAGNRVVDMDKGSAWSVHASVVYVNPVVISATIVRNFRPVSRRHIQVKSLASEELILTKAIAVEVERLDAEFRAEIPEVELYAFADSESEAVKEVLEDFVDLCGEVLGKADAKLGKSARKWKRFLASVVSTR